ncbi:Hypothetical protein FKW44_013396, partial [Caligus rogercresseyi]
AIIISTAARYNAFSIRIPGTDNIPWKYAGDWCAFTPPVPMGIYNSSANFTGLQKI